MSISASNSSYDPIPYSGILGDGKLYRSALPEDGFVSDCRDKYIPLMHGMERLLSAAATRPGPEGYFEDQAARFASDILTAVASAKGRYQEGLLAAGSTACFVAMRIIVSDPSVLLPIVVTGRQSGIWLESPVDDLTVLVVGETTVSLDPEHTGPCSVDSAAQHFVDEQNGGPEGD